MSSLSGIEAATSTALEPATHERKGRYERKAIEREGRKERKGTVRTERKGREGRKAGNDGTLRKRIFFALLAAFAFELLAAFPALCVQSSSWS